MTITKQDVAKCIEANPLLHGLTKDGLAARRPRGWPDPEPYPESLGEDMLETIGCAIGMAEAPAGRRGEHFASRRTPSACNLVPPQDTGSSIKPINIFPTARSSSRWPGPAVA